MAGMPDTPTCPSNESKTPPSHSPSALSGSPRQNMSGLALCAAGNNFLGEFGNLLSGAVHGFAADVDKVLIECPGATLYFSGTNKVAAGVRFIDNDDPSKGYEIVGKAVYGPKHVRRRWVRKQDAHLIRRCQSCQDHTVRMRRKEGADLYIPSRKSPEIDPSRSCGTIPAPFVL